MYFIEGFYLYTEVGSSGRGVLASSGVATGTIHITHVSVKRTLQREVQGMPIIDGGYWRR